MHIWCHDPTHESKGDGREMWDCPTCNAEIDKRAELERIDPSGYMCLDCGFIIAAKDGAFCPTHPKSSRLFSRISHLKETEEYKQLTKVSDDPSDDTVKA